MPEIDAQELKLCLSGVTIEQLQAAHVERQEEWCPDQKPDLSFRGNEMAGEVGEACNVIKKLERERQGWRGSRATKAELADELADVVHTAILCAITAGVDLGSAVVNKFNATSEKNGLASRIRSALSPSGDDRGEPVAILSRRVLDTFDVKGTEIVDAMLFPTGCLRPEEEVAVFTATHPNPDRIAEASEETGWLIEHAESPASSPKYWAGAGPFCNVADARRSSSWTGNPHQAIRFARKIDAQRTSDRCAHGIPTRIAKHIWNARS